MRLLSLVVLVCLSLTGAFVSASTPEVLDFETTQGWRTEADLLGKFKPEELKCAGIVPYQKLVTGMELSSEKVKRGRTSGKWGDHPRFPTLATSEVPRDWSDYNQIGFWAFSQRATGENVYVTVRSNSEATPWSDYYIARFRVDWTGWRRFDIPFSAFETLGEPAGWDHVDALLFCTMLFLNTPSPETVLYLDAIDLKSGDEPTGEHLLAIERPENYLGITPEFREEALNHPYPELAGDEPVLAPIQYEPYFKADRALFGYNPKFETAPVSFSPDGQAWIKYGLVVETLDENGKWEIRDARPVIDRYLRETMKWKQYAVRDGGFYDEVAIRFDQDGDAYMMTLVQELDEEKQAFKDVDRRARSVLGLLLHSTDGLNTWKVYQLPLPFARFEKIDGHNQDALKRPPVIMLHHHWVDYEDRRGYILIPEKQPDGSLRLPEPVLVTQDCQRFNFHSGDGNSAVTSGDKVFIVFGMMPVEGKIVNPLPIPGNHAMVHMSLSDRLGRTYYPRNGTPAYAVTYDIKTREVSEPVFLGFGGRILDNHNWPNITIDSKGYLHVIMLGHHDPLFYTRSKRPWDISEWTDPEAVSTGVTYGSLNCDRDDTLYVVSRCSGSTYRFSLALHRKKADGPWEKERYLVNPFKLYYKTWTHKVTYDPFRDRLFLSYFAQSRMINAFEDELDTLFFRWPDLEEFVLPSAQRGGEFNRPTNTARMNPRKYEQYSAPQREPCVLVTKDGGDTWQIAVTPDFE